MWGLIVLFPDHCLSFYLAYEFKKVKGHFGKIIISYKMIIRQVSCLLISPVKLNNFAPVF